MGSTLPARVTNASPCEVRKSERRCTRCLMFEARDSSARDGIHPAGAQDRLKVRQFETHYGISAAAKLVVGNAPLKHVADQCARGDMKEFRASLLSSSPSGTGFGSCMHPILAVSRNWVLRVRRIFSAPVGWLLTPCVRQGKRSSPHGSAGCGTIARPAFPSPLRDSARTPCAAYCPSPN